MLSMDEYAEVEHTPECYWVKRKLKKTKSWWRTMGLKSCPTCNGKVNL